MSPVIKFESVSKQYRLGQVGTGTLAHDINRAWARIRGKPDPYVMVGTENNREARGGDYVWALKDISFDLNQGDVLGIIGRNGAGKSTLLKLLSRIMAPTLGTIKANGRIASLLEVGTGFHHELTGRENIYLNGAILGMSRNEISKQFSNIVDFSGCAKYIDTPVKRYSSGMMVRLGFAVAAHLQCEILIVDEVLAVGDAEFQKKCLGKLGEVSREGKTILFVTHNMGPVLQTCTRGLLLKNGSVAYEGTPRETVEIYLSDSNTTNTGVFIATSLSSRKDVVITKAQCVDKTGVPADSFAHNEPIDIEVFYRVNRWVEGLVVRMMVRDSSMRCVFTTETDVSNEVRSCCEEIYAKVKIPDSFLRPGTYWFTFSVIIPDLVQIDIAENVYSVSVLDGGTRWSKSEGAHDYGCVFAQCVWELRGEVANS